MFYFWLGLGLLTFPALAVFLFLVWLHFRLRWKYLYLMGRIFQEKPLFIVPRGQPIPDAEDVKLTTPDGLTLRGCYLPARSPRQGVILFGLEFGSNRWACVQYCDYLRDAGFDVFAVEYRNQGDSDRLPGYEPLQWVTYHEVQDMLTALKYLKSRPDADPRGVGLFGISKGGGAGLFAAARDPYIRCAVTDGVFGVYSTMVPYIRKWFGIYNNRYWLQELIPDWYYGQLGLVGLGWIEKERGCRFPHLEGVIRKLAPRPLLMIHGGSDTYIKPKMARALFERAGQPKEFWVVKGAKHNQALQVANGEYRRRVLEFFQKHLASAEQAPPSPKVRFPAPRGRAPVGR